MYIVFFFVVLYAVACCAIKDLEQSQVIFNRISNYFESDPVKEFGKEWAVHQIPIQTAIEQALHRDYAIVNTLQDQPVAMTLSRGFFVDDNVVQVALGNLILRELPELRMTDVVADLPSNVISVEADLATVYIDTNYRLLRNESDIVYETNLHENLYTYSPFSYQQVQATGELTIIAENCRLSGYAVARFGFKTAYLGANSFVVTKCNYNVEISSTGSGSPPVIAPYFPVKQAELLNSLLTAPLKHQLSIKLQSAVYSYINIDKIFVRPDSEGDELRKLINNYRLEQENIFKYTEEYIERWVNTVNVKGSLILDYQLGVKQLTDRTVSLLEKGADGQQPQPSKLMLSNIVVNGLDNSHSTHTGGPIRIKGLPQILEIIRYDSLQIRGNFELTQNDNIELIPFGGELIDVHAVLTCVSSERRDQGGFGIQNFNWRNIELSLKNVKKRVELRFFTQSMIVGFLLDKLATDKPLLNEGDLQRDNIDKDYAKEIGNGLKLKEISQQLLSNAFMNSDVDSPQKLTANFDDDDIQSDTYQKDDNDNFNNDDGLDDDIQDNNISQETGGKRDDIDDDIKSDDNGQDDNDEKDIDADINGDDDNNGDDNDVDDNNGDDNDVKDNDGDDNDAEDIDADITGDDDNNGDNNDAEDNDGDDNDAKDIDDDINGDDDNNGDNNDAKDIDADINGDDDNNGDDNDAKDNDGEDNDGPDIDDDINGDDDNTDGDDNDDIDVYNPVTKI